MENTELPNHQEINLVISSKDTAKLFGAILVANVIAYSGINAFVAYRKTRQKARDAERVKAVFAPIIDEYKERIEVIFEEDAEDE